MIIDVLFGPADFNRLPSEDLRSTTCVVFDVLRATSTMVTALAHGAASIRPVTTIAEAVELRRQDPEVLLAGERGGLRIDAGQTGGAAFDLGNSPREFTREWVSGRRLVMTTTNGTRALRACGHAGMVVAAGFLNLAAVEVAVAQSSSSRLILVCSGTGEATAFEDVLGAGALIERYGAGHSAELTDAALIARSAWRAALPDFRHTLRTATNARRLLAIPDLAADVDYCASVDTEQVVPILYDGSILR